MDESLFEELLEKLPDDVIRKHLVRYISKNNLHSTYIELIVKLNKDYIDNSNRFITSFKQCVNTLYVDKHGNRKVLKNVDINETNWFWYARLLRHTEDEVYPKLNFLQPTYLLKRLKDITDTLTDKDLIDEELKELYDMLTELYEKYKLNKEESNI